MENKHFFARIYRFTGATFLGPHNEWDLARTKQEFVIAFNPAQKVDPKGLYMYVSDGDTTYSVSKRTLEEIDTVSIEWNRTRFMTHNSEVMAKLKAMNEYFNQYKQSVHNFPPDTFSTAI